MGNNLEKVKSYRCSSRMNLGVVIIILLLFIGVGYNAMTPTKSTDEITKEKVEIQGEENKSIIEEDKENTDINVEKQVTSTTTDKVEPKDIVVSKPQVEVGNKIKPQTTQVSKPSKKPSKKPSRKPADTSINEVEANKAPEATVDTTKTENNISILEKLKKFVNSEKFTFTSTTNANITQLTTENFTVDSWKELLGANFNTHKIKLTDTITYNLSVVDETTVGINLSATTVSTRFDDNYTNAAIQNKSVLSGVSLRVKLNGAIEELEKNQSNLTKDDLEFITLEFKDKIQHRIKEATGANISIIIR